MAYAVRDHRNGYVEFLRNEELDKSEDDQQPFITITKLKCGWVVRDERDGSYSDPWGRKTDAVDQAKLLADDDETRV